MESVTTFNRVGYIDNTSEHLACKNMQVHVFRCPEQTDY